MPIRSLAPVFLVLLTGMSADLAGPVTATVERVIDGDTIRMRALIWVDQEVGVSVRVAGVDAPELFRPNCAAEKKLAIAAKSFVEAFLADGAATLTDIHHDKYGGRVVANVGAAGGDLGAALIAARLASPQEDFDWCAEMS